MQATTGKILTQGERDELDEVYKKDAFPLPVDIKVDTIRRLQNANQSDRRSALKAIGRNMSKFEQQCVHSKLLENKRRAKNKAARKSRRQQRK